MSTSARSTRRMKISWPSVDLRSRVMLSLLRCRFWKSPSRRAELICGTLLDGDSTWIARAPQSASWRTAVGPERPVVRSSTRYGDSGSEDIGLVLLSSRPCSGGTEVPTVAEAAAITRSAREAPRQHRHPGARLPAAGFAVLRRTVRPHGDRRRAARRVLELARAVRPRTVRHRPPAAGRGRVAQDGAGG